MYSIKWLSIYIYTYYQFVLKLFPLSICCDIAQCWINNFKNKMKLNFADVVIPNVRKIMF